MNGKSIREIRNSQKMTQMEISEKLGIDQGTYSNYENNRCLPGINTIEKMADLFQVSIDELLGYKKKNFTASEQKLGLLNIIEKLNDIECHKLTVYAEGMIMNRMAERDEKVKKIYKGEIE